MDKNVLTEYNDMQQEAKDLRRRIEKNKRELECLNKSIVVDSVTCGKKGKKPLRTVKVQGIPNLLIKHKEEALKENTRKLERKEQQLLNILNDVEDYIESIEKSELRTMFRLFFLDDLSYKKVATCMNEMFPNKEIKYTDENVRKKIQRFFENVPQCPDKTC